jgi:hypothetical protein
MDENGGRVGLPGPDSTPSTGTRGVEYVVTDELGVPVHPEWYSDEFGRLLERVAVPGSRCTTPGTPR